MRRRIDEKINGAMQKIEADEFDVNDRSKLNFWLSMVEKYDYDKVVSICLRAGTTPETAEKIAIEVDNNFEEDEKQTVLMSEIRKLIFALLYKYDWASAKRFKTDEIYIRTSGEKFEIFDRTKISRSLIKETGISEEQADAVAMDVEKFIKNLSLSYVSSPLIREIANVKLLEYGLEDARKRYTRIGMPIYDVEQMISKGISTDIKRENANLQHTPETINWIISGETLEQYAMLKLFPQNLIDSHLSGDYHIHILSNAATRPNCVQHYTPLFFKYGLKVDGTGMHTSVAGPAKHLSVAIQHCAKILLAAQTQMAGGQSIDCFNVWLAPFVKGLNNEEIKQAAQEFIYELNQCFDYSNPIILIDKNKERVTPIGEFVEDKLGNKNKLILNEDVFTYTFDKDLNLKKTKIIAVAKRKKKENEKILEVTTRNGRSLKVTENHPLFIFKDGLKLVPAKDIKEDDIVLTFKKIISHEQEISEINLIDFLVKTLNEKELSFIFVTGFKGLTDHISHSTRLNFAQLAKMVDIPKKDFRRWRESKRGSAPIKVVYNLINRYSGKINYNNLKIKYGAGSFVSLPAFLKFEQDFMRFLGYYVSEGHAVKDGNTIKISTEANEIAQDLMNFSKRYGIKMCKVSSNDYNFNSKILYTLIVKAFGCGTHAHKKRVPNFIFNSNIQARIEFLKAYMAGDGGFWDSWAGCTTTSQLLAHDLLLLFLKFGIVPSIKKINKGEYKQQVLLGIFGKNNLDLFSKIGFSLSRKQDRLEYYLNGFEDALTRTRDIIPLSTDSLNFIRENKVFRYYGRDKVTPHNFENLLTLGLKTELNMLNDFVFWDVISKVGVSETYSQDVYDIETEDHSFLSGFGFGFLAHNSYVARGGQVVFSNIDLEFGIPDWLKEVPAIGPGGKEMGVYGDYEEESIKFLKEYVKIKIKGDHVKKQHMWPNDVFKVRKDTFKKYPEEIKLVHDFIVKYGTPYIANGLPEWQTENFNYMGCLSADTPLPYINDSSNHLSSIGNLAEKYFEKFGTKSYGVSVYTEPENLSVFSWNPEKNIIEKKKVLKIIKNPPTDLLEIRTTKGKKIKVTKDHPFFRIARRKYWLKKTEQVNAKDLTIGDRILAPKKLIENDKKAIGSVKILEINNIESNEPVYDLEVEDNHTFISGQGLFIHSNCRTRLDSAYAGPWGTVRTGNDIYITLNLPRIAYESKGNDDKFFEILNKRLEKMAQVLIIKHNITDNLLHTQNLLRFLSQKFGNEEYYDLKNTTKTFGYAGLTEAAKYHTGYHLHENKEAQDFGVKVIKRMREYCTECTKKHGLRFSLIASPAETCAARLSKLDIARFGRNAIFSGTKEASYYTNSHMIKMDANLPLAEKINIEQAYHPLTNGGHILHIFLGEQSPNSESLLEMTKKICKTNIGFFAYTRDFSVCNPCSSFEYGLKTKCKNCGSDDLSRYSRITGYYQRVEGWNPSKKQELKERYRYNSSSCNLN